MINTNPIVRTAAICQSTFMTGENHGRSEMRDNTVDGFDVDSFMNTPLSEQIKKKFIEFGGDGLSVERILDLAHVVWMNTWELLDDEPDVSTEMNGSVSTITEIAFKAAMLEYYGRLVK